MTGAETPGLIPPHLALVILDGLGDRPHPDTGGLSPVEAAETPNLDRLLKLGRFGRVEVVGPGIAPESDAGVFALLGFDPVTDSPGRGVLEALGVEIPLAPGDVAFRLNFATGGHDGSIQDARVGRTLSTTEAKELARDLSAADLVHDLGIHAEVRATIGHRGVLWLHSADGSSLSPEVSNSDPFYERIGGLGQAKPVEHPHALPVHPLVDGTAEHRTAEATNRFLERAIGRLATHSVNARRALAGRLPANLLLVRNAGARRAGATPGFLSRHGIAGAAVTEMPVERGIATYLGLKDVFVGPMGRDRDAALRERAAKTAEAMRTSPFVYVHLKGPDEPGHDGKALEKKAIVEALDRSFFGPFVAGIDWSTTRLAVTADHATPCSVRGHSDDPVPFLLVGAGIPAFRTVAGEPPKRKFGERAAADGELGTHRGRQVLDLLTGRHAAVPTA